MYETPTYYKKAMEKARNNCSNSSIKEITRPKLPCLQYEEQHWPSSTYTWMNVQLLDVLFLKFIEQEERKKGKED